MAEEGSSQQRAHSPPLPLPLTAARRSIRAVDSLHGLPPFGVSYFPGAARYIAGRRISNAVLLLPLPLVPLPASAGDVTAEIGSSLPPSFPSPNNKHCDMANHSTEENTKKSEEESHVCSICSKSYSSSRGLGRHMAVHNNAMSAPEKGSKRSHADTLHEGSSSLPGNDGSNVSSPSKGKCYICKICGKSYTSHYAFGGHVAGHKKALQPASGKRVKSKSGSIVPDVTDGPKDFVAPSSPRPNLQLNESSRSLSPDNDESGCEEPVSKKGKESED